MSNKVNLQLQQWQEEVIKRQFKLHQGLKQLIQDERKEGIILLANSTNINVHVINQNIKTLKSL